MLWTVFVIPLTLVSTNAYNIASRYAQARFDNACSHYTKQRNTENLIVSKRELIELKRQLENDNKVKGCRHVYNIIERQGVIQRWCLSQSTDADQIVFITPPLTNVRIIKKVYEVDDPKIQFLKRQILKTTDIHISLPEKPSDIVQSLKDSGLDPFKRTEIFLFDYPSHLLLAEFQDLITELSHFENDLIFAVPKWLEHELYMKILLNRYDYRVLKQNRLSDPEVSRGILFFDDLKEQDSWLIHCTNLCSQEPRPVPILAN
jgi:hypothetical protein